MFFALSKTVGFFLSLPNAVVLLVVLAVLGLWTRWFRFFRVFATVSMLLLALCAFSPLSLLLLRPLEDRFPRPQLTGPPAGIIVLGGSTDEFISFFRDTVALNESAERLTEAVRLARLYPTARLVFSGGSSAANPPTTEAAVARRLWTEMGLSPDRITVEDRSRNTWENAVFTKEIIGPQPSETWLLVTSASHMPRSVGIFRKVGLTVLAYPVDYRTMGNGGDFKTVRKADQSFQDLATAWHEWIGLGAYYLTGKTSALFPAS